MEKVKDKQVTISPAMFTEFEKLATSFHLTNKGLLEAMVLYFKATKADPRDPKADNPTDAIKALDKRLIGFIREQEKKLLIPILDELRVSNKLLMTAQEEQKESVKLIRQSQIKTIGGAIKKDLLNPEFLEAVKNLNHGS